MRTLIILARKHGGKKLEMVGGPEVPVHQQSADFKKDFCRSDVNEVYEYAELWSSDAGRLKYRKLQSGKTAAAKVAARANAVEDAKKRAAEKAELARKQQEQALAEEKAKRDAVLAAKAARHAQVAMKPGSNPARDAAEKQAAEEAARKAKLEAEQKRAAEKTNKTKSE
jgi:hypothetical protein